MPKEAQPRAQINVAVIVGDQNTAAARASVDQVRKMFAGRTFRDSSELIQRDRAR
jgi:hypothetical protein